MPCPPDIRDALESVIDVFFSGSRHRERAAFILCDNLVEVACKRRALDHNHQFTGRGFHAITTAPGVNLGQLLQRRVAGYRNTRNNLQHVAAALTVDEKHCADAILDSVRVLDRLWTGTSGRFAQPMRVALRVVRLVSTQGEAAVQQQFDDRLRDWGWRTAPREPVATNAVQIRPGLKEHWGFALRYRYTDIETCLNELGCA